MRDDGRFMERVCRTVEGAKEDKVEKKGGNWCSVGSDSQIYSLESSKTRNVRLDVGIVPGDRNLSR